MIRSLYRRLTQPLRGEDGSMLVESVLVLPLMFWAYLGLYSYWDAYRALTTMQKATYAVSDLISREQKSVNAAYIDGMRKVMNSMLPNNESTTMRVTSVSYSGVRNRYEVEWSNSPLNALPALTTATIVNYTSQIPTLTDGDNVVIVESRVAYKPAVRYGLPAQTFSQFIVTRPRFVPKIVFQ